jgi:hypothetical protein
MDQDLIWLDRLELVRNCILQRLLLYLLLKKILLDTDNKATPARGFKILNTYIRLLNYRF